MSKSLIVITLGILVAALVLAPAPAHAQNWYELNGHVGGFRYDIEDSDTDVLLGARMMLQYGSGWAWGGNFDWVNVDRDVGGTGIDIDLYLYSLGIEYMFPSASQFRFFGAAGAGAATGRVSDLPPAFPDDDESKTHLLVPLGVGFKWYNDPVLSRASWAIRGDVRDNIIFVGDESVIFGDEDEAKNNFEFSGGISFLF
ncbi:MAG TPA: outer membrane beta-barrel protein [Gemmatimonadota bacterium]|nr:outer membrane beta-barrel protein [Gemmatimonadota bacterium]